MNETIKEYPYSQPLHIDLVAFVHKYFGFSYVCDGDNQKVTVEKEQKETAP